MVTKKHHHTPPNYVKPCFLLFKNSSKLTWYPSLWSSHAIASHHLHCFTNKIKPENVFLFYKNLISDDLEKRLVSFLKWLAKTSGWVWRILWQRMVDGFLYIEDVWTWGSFRVGWVGVLGSLQIFFVGFTSHLVFLFSWKCIFWIKE